MMPPKPINEFLKSWAEKLKSLKKKIADDEKITEMRMGGRVAFYIRHAEESTLPSSDKRKSIILQYKILASLLDYVNSESLEDIKYSLDRAVASLYNFPEKRTSGNMVRMKKLVNQFHNELKDFILAEQKSRPSDTIKR